MVTRAMWSVLHVQDLHWREWDREFVVYDERSGDTHRLNSLAAFVLRALGDGSQTVELLAQRASSDLSIPLDSELTSTVDTLLHQLSDLGLIERSDS
jgi:PqqD family protein of HPr-rel-A system